MAGGMEGRERKQLIKESAVHFSPAGYQLEKSQHLVTLFDCLSCQASQPKFSATPYEYLCNTYPATLGILVFASILLVLVVFFILLACGPLRG